jgi:hypothetical protein
MKCYVLLRNNKQEGPFSFEELVAKNLKNDDLIQSADTGSHWHYPFEIEELRPYLSDTRFNKNSTEEKIRFHRVAVHILGLMAAVLSGLLIVGAVSMKNLVKHKKTPIFLPVSLSSSKFSTPALPEGKVPNQPFNKHIQNALVTEYVGVETRINAHRSQILDNLKKQVSVTGNDYKGNKNKGISNLYLTIENKSFVFLRNVSVQVDYLNSVGSLINSQIITIKNIPARGEKSWRIVDGKKGVKVQYKILDIFPKKQKTNLFEA